MSIFGGIFLIEDPKILVYNFLGFYLYNVPIYNYENA